MAQAGGKEFRGRDRARLLRMWNAMESIEKMDAERDAINAKKGTDFKFVNDNDIFNAAWAKVKDRLAWAFSKKRK